MGWPQFLAWAATQGFKNIKLLRQAYNSFKKLPPKEVILKTAKNLYDDVIKKTSTKDLTKQIRQKIKPINVPEQTKNILNIKSTLKGRPVKVVPERPFTGFKPAIVPKTKIVPKKPDPLGDALKAGKYKKVPTPSGLKPPGLKKSNVIPFPKKPPGKADGGRIDKALPGRSRDI